MIIVVSVLAYLIAAFLLNKWLKRRNTEEDFEPNSKVEGDISEEDSKIEEEVEEEQDEKKKTEKKNEIETSQILPFAKAAKTESETRYVLEQNNSAKVQYALAKTKVFEVQAYLLKYSMLKANALVEICENHSNFNFDNYDVQKWFNRAMDRTKLKPEQEVRIANCKNYAIKIALLRKSNLSGDGLVAFCQNTGTVNLESETVRAWIDDAVKRTKLTPEHEAKIAQTGFYEMQRALMLMRPNLSYEGFLEICKNPKEFRMSSDTVQNWFRKVTKRLAPTLNSEQKFELAKTKIEGVLEGLV